jgi:hypothetical protein
MHRLAPAREADTPSTTDAAGSAAPLISTCGIFSPY